MKKTFIYTIAATLICVFTHSCTKDFETTNVDPSVVSDVDVRFLFTSSLEKLETYRGGEWIWEDLEQLLRYSQLLTAEAYEITGSVNGRYNAFYSGILPNLVEIRRLIDLKPDKEKYQKIYAVTYIVQAFQGLKVTDMNGSIPYTEAIQGRFEGKYDPAYDNQKTLYDTWLKELDEAKQSLQADVADQVILGNNDVYYQGDWTKWIRLANSLKLRIAARYQNPDQAAGRKIFKEVMTDATGPFGSTADQMTYRNTNYYPYGANEIDYRSRRYAVETVVDFMKSTGDPRLAIYFDKNSLAGAFRDTLSKYNTTLPAWINLNDTLIMYQGGPANWQANPEKSAYFSNLFNAGGANRYSLISTVNRKFFSPRVDESNGNFVDVLVSYAEVCFYIAEFIQKGYVDGFDPKGTAADWYNKGVRASVITMNQIAAAAGSTTVANPGPRTEAYLLTDKVRLDGTNSLEKIYIQQLLNFYRQGNEAFTLVRRTGYPKFNSSILPRQVMSEIIPRRYWLTDPGEVNRANWNAAMTEQGFTPNDRSLVKLNAERIWFDKNSPNFGEGN